MAKYTFILVNACIRLSSLITGKMHLFVWQNILLSWPMRVFSAHCTESVHPHSSLVKSSLLKSVWIKLSHVIYSFAHSKIQSLQRVFIYYTNSFAIWTGIYISISINCFLNGSFAWFMSTNSMGLSMHFSKDANVVDNSTNYCNICKRINRC